MKSQVEQLRAYYDAMKQKTEVLKVTGKFNFFLGLQFLDYRGYFSCIIGNFLFPVAGKGISNRKV